MKGVILAGGTGSRLSPLTNLINKHLLPVYNKPMIYYPIETLKKIGIKDILIVSGRGHAGSFLELLGSGRDLGLNFSFTIQESEGGIAEALSLAEDFSGGENISVILGDNIFEDNFFDEINDFNSGARIFLKKVVDPERFGVAEIYKDRIIDIVEKPKSPITDFAVTGLYVYDNKIFDIIRKIKPSLRGELEITDVNNIYIKNNEMDFRIVNGFWSDAGTFESLFRSSKFIKNKLN